MIGLSLTEVILAVLQFYNRVLRLQLCSHDIGFTSTVHRKHWCFLPFNEGFKIINSFALNKKINSNIRETYPFLLPCHLAVKATQKFYRKSHSLGKPHRWTFFCPKFSGRSFGYPAKKQTAPDGKEIRDLVTSFEMRDRSSQYIFVTNKYNFVFCSGNFSPLELNVASVSHLNQGFLFSSQF